MLLLTALLLHGGFEKWQYAGDYGNAPSQLLFPIKLLEGSKTETIVYCRIVSFVAANEEPRGTDSGYTELYFHFSDTAHVFQELAMLSRVRHSLFSSTEIQYRMVIFQSCRTCRIHFNVTIHQTNQDIGEQTVQKSELLEVI